MKRLGGPQLKLPERVKVPPFLVDLYWDLRDRHLLPLVALALVACVAAPILLGGGSKSEAPAVSPSSSGAAGGEGRTLVVAKAEPGLREPSKRLRGRPARDPFRQHLSGKAHQGPAAGVAGRGGMVPVESREGATTIATTTGQPAAEPPAGTGGGQAPGGGSATGAEPGPAPSGPAGAETNPAVRPPGSHPAPHQPSGPNGGNGEGGGGGHDHGGGSGSVPDGSGQIQIFTFAIDVKITKTTTEADGSKSKPEVIGKDRVVPSSPLPYKKRQVITYMGISPKTQQPLFLVSEGVSAIFGEAQCVAGEGRCQLVELEKGFPVIFVYGENDARYKFEVLKIEPVVTGHT